MTNINGINKMVVGSTEWENIHKKLGDVNNSKIDDDEVLFETMQYYEVSNRSDGWSAAAQELSIEELIEKWKEFDAEDTSFAKDFDEFDAYMRNYKPDEPPAPEDEDIIRPYIPKPLTPEQEARMEEFDRMRAEDSHANLDKEGDYELLYEYVCRREGTSFLYPSDYNADGTVNEKGQAKIDEMVAKLAEIDKGDNDIGDILEEFLKVYNEEPDAYETVDSALPAGLKAEVADVKAGESKEITIGNNVYLITNNGADGNKLSYEVKTNDKGEQYLEMNGNNWRIHDISGKLQNDKIQVNGEGNELDLAMGDDIAYLVGNDNRALMGDGDDKVYIEGNNVFSDLWRGDDELFNINSDNTMAVGFTGDDKMYIKGDNVKVSGENHDGVDGIYKDGEIQDKEFETTLEKPDWFPGPDEPEPGPDPGPGVVEEDGPVDIEIDGITYRVYKKTSRNNPTDVLTYYKADDGRTVFEANGWDITVVSEDNTTGDGKYADVVIKGDRISFHGSKSEDAIEVQGNDNNIYGDYSHTEGGDDDITISSGSNNYIYGEVGNDNVTTKTEGNFFNEAILDVETANGQEQDLTPPQKPSAWKTVENPNKSQLAQMEAARQAFGLPKNAAFKKVQQNGSTMGMSYNSQAYLTKTNADGTIASVTKKDDGVTLAKVEFTYKNGKVATTTTTDYQNNTITVVDAEGNKTVTKYDDVKATNKQPISTVTTAPDGTVKDNQVVDKKNNTITTTAPDGSSTVVKYDDVTSKTGKPISAETKDAKGNVTATTTYDYDKDIETTTNADGSKTVTLYDDLTVPTSIQEIKTYDKAGKLTSTTTYKNGKEDMKMPTGNVMTVKAFFEKVDVNKDGKITEAELKELYNKTNDPTLKGILSNFTDGNAMTFAYELAATNGSGRKAYAKDKVLTLADATKMISENGNITSNKIADLQTKAAYASLVGYELGNSWYVNRSDGNGQMTTQNPAYALTNKEGKEYDDMTMVLLNAAGGNSVNRDDLAQFGIKTAEDYNNKELFNQLRAGADILSAVGFQVDGWNFKALTAQQVLNAYNKTTDENVKKACLATGLITVGTDNIARVANGKTNVSKFEGNVRDFYKTVLVDIVGYANIKKPEKNK